MATLIFSSCDKDSLRISPSGPTSTKIYTLENYEQLDVSHQFDVYVTLSETEDEIRVEAHAEIHPYIVVERQGKSLQVKFDRNLNIRSDATPKVYITTEEIDTYRASGEVYIKLEDDLQTDILRVDLSGESTFLAHIDVKTSSVDLSGDAEVHLSGVSETLDLNGSGDIEVRDYNLQTQHFKCHLSGDADVQVSINQTMDIAASGESRIRYRGNAIINSQRLTGDAKIIKVN